VKGTGSYIAITGSRWVCRTHTSYGLAIALIFIGLKMLIIDLYKIPITWSLSFTALTLVLTMVLSSVIPSRGSSGGAYPFSARPSSRSTEEPR